MIRNKLNRIRKAEKTGKQNAAMTAISIFAAGIALGIFSKWLDNLGLDSSIWWHVLLLAALAIAVFSRSAVQASMNVFVFFAGMCAAYHLYTILFSGFNPASYMMIWYGITLLSPFIAILCWYAKGSGPAAILLDAGIMTVFFLTCFSIGLFYISLRGLLYLLVFAGAAAVLYRTPKQLGITLLAGFLLSFLLCTF